MRSIDLSIKIILIQWTNLCVDWFMNLFADADYYWVDESYPSASTNNHPKRNKVDVIVSSNCIKSKKPTVNYLNKALLKINFNIFKKVQNTFMRYTRLLIRKESFYWTEIRPNNLINMEFLV